MKIVLASDHGGFELKEEIKAHLIKKGYDVIDIGVKDTQSVDRISIFPEPTAT